MSWRVQLASGSDGIVVGQQDAKPSHESPEAAGVGKFGSASKSRISRATEERAFLRVRSLSLRTIFSSGWGVGVFSSANAVRIPVIKWVGWHRVGSPMGSLRVGYECGSSLVCHGSSHSPVTIACWNL